MMEFWSECIQTNISYLNQTTQLNPIQLKPTTGIWQASRAELKQQSNQENNKSKLEHTKSYCIFNHHHSSSSAQWTSKDLTARNSKTCACPLIDGTSITRRGRPR